MNKWVASIHNLSDTARIQPHAAYTAFINGLCSKWTYMYMYMYMYLLRTVPDIADFLQPLKDAIRSKFIPALTGRECVNDAERDLFALLALLGGLGLNNPVKTCNHEFTLSVDVTAPLATLILLQQPDLTPDTIYMYMYDQQRAKARTRKTRRQHQSNTAIELKAQLPHHLQRAMELGSEKGASSWLSTLPIEDHGFALHKGAFHDAFCMRYNWQPTHLPSKCIYGKAFSTDHALSCPTGGLPTIRHNELRDFTANVMTEVCHDVCIEPSLQPISGEALLYATSTNEDEACLVIRAQGFWGNLHQRAFFDMRVFNPNGLSYRKLDLASAYHRARARPHLLNLWWHGKVYRCCLQAARISAGQHARPTL